MRINFITRHSNEQDFQDFHQLLVRFLDIGLVLLDTKLLAPGNKKLMSIEESECEEEE